MRQFFKLLFASCLGTLLALFIIFLLGASVMGAIVKRASQPAQLGGEEVLHLSLKAPIPELTENIEVTSFDPTRESILGIHDMVRAIEHARTDDRIKGIYLDAATVDAGFSTLTLLRDALMDFRNSGKFIVAHAGYYSQSAYYLASVADRVYVAPQGIVDFRGFSVQIPFLKNMLDKVGVEMQVFYAGEFKSATEPFRRTSMSAESRLQTREFLDDRYALLLERIAIARGVSVAQLQRAANEFAGIDPQLAKAQGLIDEIGYREAAIQELRQRLNYDEDRTEEPPMVKMGAYHSARLAHPNRGGQQLALLIAEGDIVDGKNEGGNIGDEDYVKVIDQLREDEAVKAVVLRVNSPGGSASASDHIWTAIERLKAVGKPVFVSMGDYAASGGYYIACNADSIYAQPGTLTGSIGVFTIFPQAQELLNDNIGITFDTVRTADLSAAFSGVMDLSETEKRLMQRRTDDLYRIFLQRVSEGRKMTVAEVDSIARGRVWTGRRAASIGLVDRVGTLEDAIAGAARAAGLAPDDYHVVTYPATKSPWERLLESFTDREATLTQLMLREHLGSQYPTYRMLQRLSSSQAPQMRLPWRLDF